MDESPSVLISQPLRPVDGLALTAGIFIILIGWVDILIGWFPLGFGSPEWEFGTVSATVDGLPLSTLGLVVMLMGASESGSRWGLWVSAVWAGWVLAVLVACGVLYALTVPVALGALGPQGLEVPLARAVLKTSTLMVIYFCFYGWMEVQAILRLKGRL